MKEPDIPANETERLAALYELQILDTPPEERFDRITEKAKQFFGVEYALFSLIDKDRQWFKSKQGMNDTEGSRATSFCGHVINYDEPMYVPDTFLDPRFEDHPAVTEPPYVRFYTGVPVKSPDGLNVGTLCIYDDKPKTLSQADFAMLREFARLVEKELVERASA